MPRDFKRSDRVADAIQRSLSNIIQKEMRDPRLGMVNINAVSVSKDLALAKIYVTFVGQDGEDKDHEKVEVLNNAASYMRSLLAKDINIRTTPRLSFMFDSSVVRGQKMTDLINRAVSSDKAQQSVHGNDDTAEKES